MLPLYLINFDDFPKFETDLYNHMSNSGDGKSNSGVRGNNVNGTINLNYPRLNVSVPSLRTAPLNNLAGACSYIKVTPTLLTVQGFDNTYGKKKRAIEIVYTKIALPASVLL
jgi:hypothetical protein